jgi:hypothetical protein
MFRGVAVGELRKRTWTLGSVSDLPKPEDGILSLEDERLTNCFVRPACALDSKVRAKGLSSNERGEGEGGERECMCVCVYVRADRYRHSSVYKSHKYCTGME